MMNKLFDQAPCGFFSFSDNGSLLQVNETAAQVLQYEKDQLPNQNVETIFSLAARIFFQTHLFPMLKMHGHAEEIFLMLLTRERQQLPVLLNAKRFTGEQPVTSCAFIVVPNRKKFEDELVAARKQAERALNENTALLEAKAALQAHTEQLEAQMALVKKQNHELQQFNHAVTHNLKEPLRKILLYSGQLQDQVASPFLQKLRRSTAQMELVITGLQQYVWLEQKTEGFEIVDLNHVLANAVSRLNNELGEAVLQLSAGNLDVVYGDKTQLQLLLYHLLHNAVKFRKDEVAHVSISSVVVKRNKFQSVGHRYEYDDFVKLEVKDEGIGFDPVYREHIFELFRRLHSGDGLGLGLALCRKIVANHLGYIEADGKEGEFTKITIWLPQKELAKTIGG